MMHGLKPYEREYLTLLEAAEREGLRIHHEDVGPTQIAAELIDEGYLEGVVLHSENQEVLKVEFNHHTITVKGRQYLEELRSRSGWSFWIKRILFWLGQIITIAIGTAIALYLKKKFGQ